MIIKTESCTIACVQNRRTRDDMVVVSELTLKKELDDKGKLNIFSTKEESKITAIHTSDAPNFSFEFVPRLSGKHELCAIKTRNTDSGKVEVHVLPRDPEYTKFTLHAVTPFEVSDAPNFDFVMGKGNGDLIGVKRRNTESDKVEVHVVSHISDYKDFIRHVPTPIDLADAVNFDFGGSLFDGVACIKRAATETGFLEVHILDPGGATWDLHGRTSIPLSYVVGRTWLFGPAPTEVLGVSNGPSGKVELIFDKPSSMTGFPAPFGRHISEIDANPDFSFKMIGDKWELAGGGGGL